MNVKNNPFPFWNDHFLRFHVDSKWHQRDAFYHIDKGLAQIWKRILERARRPKKKHHEEYHLTVSFSSIFRSADLWSPILERSDGFAPKCYSTLLRQPAQKPLSQIIGSQIITIIFLVGLSKGSWNKCDLRCRDVCSGKVICTGVICNFLRAQTYYTEFPVMYPPGKASHSGISIPQRLEWERFEAEKYLLKSLVPSTTIS